MEETGTLPVAHSAAEVIAKRNETAGLRTKVVPVPDWGLSLKIRPLTRGEIREIGLQDMDPTESEAHSFSCAVVEPRFTPEEALDLLAGSPFDTTQAIMEEITNMSGLGAGFREGDEDKAS